MKVKKKIFISTAFSDDKQKKMIKSLERANFDIVYSPDSSELKSTICSVHYLGQSLSEHEHTNAVIDFEKVNNFTIENKNYKSFFWNPKQNIHENLENELADKIQRELKNNMILAKMFLISCTNIPKLCLI